MRFLFGSCGCVSLIFNHFLTIDNFLLHDFSITRAALTSVVLYLDQ